MNPVGISRRAHQPIPELENSLSHYEPSDRRYIIVIVRALEPHSIQSFHGTAPPDRAR